MSLPASLDQFKTAVKILQQFTVDNVNNNLQNMESHLTLAQSDHQSNMKQLRQTLTRYKKAQSQMTYQQSSIQTYTIEPWVPVVSSYQNTSVYKTSLTASVSQIIQAKKTINSLSNTMGELEIKVTTQAKTAKGSSDNLDRIQQQIFILRLALDLNNFLSNNRINASGIADFELQKYYDSYMKGGS